MGRIFLIIILLLVYGSLYPFQFHARGAAPGPFWVLLHSWPASVDFGLLRDAVINLLIYLPFGIFGSLWLGKGKVNARAAAKTILLGGLLSASMELLQTYDASRYCGLTDLLMNTAGAGVGVLLAYIFCKAITRLERRPEIQGAFNPSGALLVLLLWAAYQTFPLIPSLSRYGVMVKLESLWSTRSFSLVEAAGALIEWLVVAALIEAIAGVKTTRKILPLFLLFLPARLLIVGRNLTWPELAGAACAWGIWNGWLWRYAKHTVLLAWLSAAMLLIRGLAPYQFQATPAKFSWVPFGSSLSYQQVYALIPFLHKGFLYGAAVWLFRGFGYIRPVIGLALLLGAIEAVQRYLPGRSPEISDPLYLVLLAIILKLLDARGRTARPASLPQSATLGPASG